jgi:autotransporter family porin
VNEGFNATRGSGSNDRYPRVDGDFTGSTDEIIQWAACKWGIDEDWARAQMAKESWWDMTVGGDLTANADACHPQVRGKSPCPESLGLSQVRFLYHGEAFEDANAIRSTAYNVDYAYAVWRSCFEGELDWLNTVERNGTYGPGDLEGCLGVWFAGRWRVSAAMDYVAAVRDYRNQRIWETPNFLSYG